MSHEWQHPFIIFISETTPYSLVTNVNYQFLLFSLNLCKCVVTSWLSNKNATRNWSAAKRYRHHIFIRLKAAGFPVQVFLVSTKKFHQYFYTLFWKLQDIREERKLLSDFVELSLLFCKNCHLSAKKKGDFLQTTYSENC